MTEFPAAHSMDTDWFAVDGEGHVARCFSDETGPVPDEALRGPWADIWMELAVVGIVGVRDAVPVDANEAALVTQIVDGDRDALAIYQDHREGRGLPREGWSPHVCAIYQLADAGVALVALADAPEYVHGIFAYAGEDDVPSGYGTRPLDERYGLRHAVIAEMSREDLAAALASGVLTHGFLVDLERIPEPHTIGIFDFEFGIDEYARTHVPARPLRLADLPPPLRERIAELRLAHSDFRRDTTIAPGGGWYRWGSG